MERAASESSKELPGGLAAKTPHSRCGAHTSVPSQGPRTHELQLSLGQLGTHTKGEPRFL